MTTEEYWYWLCNIEGVYQSTIQRLWKAFSGPDEVYKASEDLLVKSGTVDPDTAHRIIQGKSSVRSLYRLDKLKKNGVSFIYYGSEKYPISLLNLEDKPWALYVKGELPDPEMPTAGIVGSRSCSGYGREMTIRYAQTLAANGIQIISGMALGIDACASSAALDVGGKTFVVLGSGLDVIYPQQNLELYYRIILNGGGIISEYPMNTPPNPWQFPQRNRLISGLSDKLLVMEARKRSGTLSTVSHALNQGKDVYALPGRVTDPLSEGCNQMIADGAGILIDPKDILKEYESLKICTKACGDEVNNDIKSDINNAACDDDSSYGKILRNLSYEPEMTEEIAMKSALPVREVSRLLSEMELLDLCVQEGQDYYRLK